MKVVGGIGQFRIRALDKCLGIRDIGLCLFDCGSGMRQTSFSAGCGGLGNVYTAGFPRNNTSFVIDFSRKRVPVRFCMGQCVGVGAVINIEERIALLYLDRKSVV